MFQKGDLVKHKFALDGEGTGIILNIKDDGDSILTIQVAWLNPPHGAAPTTWNSRTWLAKINAYDMENR